MAKNKDSAPNPFDPRENPDYEYVPYLKDPNILWHMRQSGPVADELKKRIFEWEVAVAASNDNLYDVEAILRKNEKQAALDTFLEDSEINRLVRERPPEQ